MGKASSFIAMAQPILDSGRKTCSMEKEKRLGRTGLHTRASITTARRMDLAGSHGLMDLNIQETFSTIALKDKAGTFGKTAESM